MAPRTWSKYLRPTSKYVWNFISNVLENMPRAKSDFKLKTMDRLAEVYNVEFYWFLLCYIFCCSIQRILFKRFNADLISKLSLNLDLTAWAKHDKILVLSPIGFMYLSPWGVSCYLPATLCSWLSFQDTPQTIKLKHFRKYSRHKNNKTETSKKNMGWAKIRQ